MLIKELAATIHQNAVAHGFWEGDPSFGEIIALIHSEWSEALEEYRANRPMVWYRCGHIAFDKICDYGYGNGDCDLCGTDDCKRMRGKPEGIAVELIDGCMRILDFFGRARYELVDRDSGMESELEDLWMIDEVNEEALVLDVPNLLCMLHACTSDMLLEDDAAPDPASLLAAMSLALTWVHQQGIDPLALILDKHEYNKSRPYRHGKRL